MTTDRPLAGNPHGMDPTLLDPHPLVVAAVKVEAFWERLQDSKSELLKRGDDPAIFGSLEEETRLLMALIATTETILRHRSDDDRTS